MTKLKLVALLILSGFTATSAVSEARSHGLVVRDTAAMLPNRTLHCTLGRALNLDPSKFQTMAEIQYDGAHPFTLFLPAARKHVGDAPDPSADPEPVNQATRIIADPAGLTREVPRKFTRVADLWPNRVELATALAPPMSHIIIISEIDEAKGTANLFMTRAADAASLDLQNVYQGGCRIQARFAQK